MILPRRSSRSSWVMSGAISSPLRIIQLARVLRGISISIRLKILSWRCNGSASWYFAVAIYASRPALALLFGMGCAGNAAVRTLDSHALQAYFNRACCSTWILAGMISSCSPLSSPICVSAQPQPQTLSASARSCSIRTRGKSAGNDLRPRDFRRSYWMVSVSASSVFSSRSSSGIDSAASA